MSLSLCNKRGNVEIVLDVIFFTCIIFIFLQDVFGKLRIWKLIASVFAFSSTLELMFGVVLLHHFRVFERQFGSNKYSLMWLTCSLLDHMASYMPPLCYFT